VTESYSTFTNVTGGNDWDQSFAGAGVVDGAAQIVKSIQDGDGLSIGGNVVAASMDVLAFFENPVKSLGTTAIGWLIEHLTFLDSFLDQTAGDPQAVQNASETFFQAAKDLDRVAAEQITAFGTGMETYRTGASPSALAFESRVRPRGDELKTLSLQCLGLGDAMNTAAMMVSTCRGIIRDLLTEFTWWVFKKGTLALAAAPYTGGGSLAYLLTDTCIAGAKMAKNFADKLATLVKDLGRLSGFLRELAGILSSTEVRAFAFSVAKNYLPSATKTVDDGVSLTAADAAEHRVAEKEAAERTSKQGLPEFEAPIPPGEKPKQEPGLGAKWTTSGTLDE
jgi:hypothetical protein